ncbi:MAG: TonB-dependent receptor [Blastocatellia bacterium]|nr:TonB-dependent receptor [Blastocatellia bacterium]
MTLLDSFLSRLHSANAQTKILIASFTLILLLMSGTLGEAKAGSEGSPASLGGRVLDESGAAVSGAMVRLSSREGLQRSAITAGDGAYAFDELKSGEYLLEVEARNFRRKVEAVRLDSDQGRAFDVTLTVAGVDEYLVVTASGTAQSVDETSKSISVVKRDEIERRDEYSLTESLRPVPGLRVSQLGGPGAFSKIFIRGLRVVDTSILIDGFRLRDAADFRGSINPFMEDLLTNNTERIEVLRGSGSSLYGSNAVGGVINIVSQEGAGPLRFDLGFEGGSLGLFREHAQVSGGLQPGFGYSFSATRLDVNDGVHEDEIYRNTSLGGRAHYNIEPHISLRGTINFTDGFNRLTDSPFPIGPAGNEFGFATGTGPVTGFVENDTNPDNFRDARLFFLGVAFSHQAGSAYNYTVSFQSVATEQIFDSGPDQSETAVRLGLFDFVSVFTSKGRIDTFNVTNNIRAGRYNLITAGLEAERESFTQEFLSPFFSTPETTDRQRSLAFFVQDQLSLLDGRLQLSAAVRTQGFTINNPESVPEIENIDVKRALTGDGSIAYTLPGPDTKLRAHVGNSFRAPSLSERFSLFQGRRIGNPFLRPERALSVDGGVDQSFLQGRVRAGATYFYSRLQEVITSTALFRQTNSRGALARGGEFTLVASPYRGLDVNTSYTYARSDQAVAADTLRFDNVVLPAGTSAPSLSIPRHSYSLEINQRFQRGFNINFDLYAVSEHFFPLFDPVFFSQVLFRFKGYTKADLGASYTRQIGENRQITFYGKVDNLFDREIFEEGFRAPGAAGVGGVKIRF